MTFVQATFALATFDQTFEPNLFEGLIFFIHFFNLGLSSAKLKLSYYVEVIVEDVVQEEDVVEPSVQLLVSQLVGGWVVG